MDQRDFNRSMDSYLKNRVSTKPGKARKGFLDSLKNALPRITFTSDEEPVQEQPEEVPREQVDAVLRGESLTKDEEIIAEEAEEEIEEALKGPSLWSRFIDWLTLSNKEEEDFDDDIPRNEDVVKVKKGHVDEDVKEMLRICVHWVNMLPPEKIQDIKRSDDFMKFKELLDRYGLLKKKE